jgi:hypothetical protein
MAYSKEAAQEVHHLITLTIKVAFFRVIRIALPKKTLM